MIIFSINCLIYRMSKSDVFSFLFCPKWYTKTQRLFIYFYKWQRKATNLYISLFSLEQWLKGEIDWQNRHSLYYSINQSIGTALMLRQVEMEMFYTCDVKPCVYSTHFEFKNVLPFYICNRYSMTQKNILTLPATHTRSNTRLNISYSNGPTVILIFYMEKRCNDCRNYLILSRISFPPLTRHVGDEKFKSHLKEKLSKFSGSTFWTVNIFSFLCSKVKVNGICLGLGQDKTFEGVIFGFGKHRSTFFMTNKRKK